MIKNIIRRFLRDDSIQRVRAGLGAIEKAVAKLHSRNAYLASLYYCFFSGQFRREHLAVLQGRAQYWRALKETGKSSAMLRRNIHRLEKGLIMRPRKDVFGADYILETVQCFSRALEGGHIDSREQMWAADVLAEYFLVVRACPKVDTARSAHEAVIEKHGESARGKRKSIPYRRGDCAVNTTFEELTALFRRRRSVRWYREVEVDAELVRKAIGACSQAPSACNRQPFRFYLTTSKTDAAEIAGYAMGTTGFADNIPAIIVVVGDLSAYPSERDRHVIYIDSSLASMQLMLALETLGLSSCPINWPDIEKREKMIAKKLGLNYYERPIMLLAVGHADPAGGIPYSQKKTDDLLVKEITDAV